MDITDISFFDLHCDAPTSEKSVVDFNTVSRFKNYKCCFAAFVHDDDKTPYLTAKNAIQNFKADKRFVIFTLENCRSLQGNISNLQNFYGMGVAAASLTWNGENELASGCYANGGIKKLGTYAIREMNRLGIATDLSHINREGFFEALRVSDLPFVSHTGITEVKEHKRNITVGMAKDVAKKGGIIGLCFYPEFICNDGVSVYEALYREMYLLCENGLENNVSLGSDFDGADMDKKLSSPEDVLYLYDYLKVKGFDNKTLDRIFFSNAWNFFKKLRAR